MEASTAAEFPPRAPLVNQRGHRKAVAKLEGKPGHRGRPRGSPKERSDGAWQVYILRCADGTLYTGCTNDLERRLRRHAQGAVKYTRGRLPIALLHQEEAQGRSAALRREAAIKKLRRAQKLTLAGGEVVC